MARPGNSAELPPLPHMSAGADCLTGAGWLSRASAGRLLQNFNEKYWKYRSEGFSPPNLPEEILDSLSFFIPMLQQKWHHKGKRTRKGPAESVPPGPQTIEKPLNLEKAAFLASFGRSWKMLRHKALGLCPKPRQARREACALWALGPKAQSDPKRGSETMSATGREARMIEQPGRPLHPIHSPCLPSLSQYSGKISSNLSPYLSGSPPANVSRRA